MPGSDNRLLKRTNTRIKILIIEEIMKVYDGTLNYILLKVSHLVTRPALLFSGRKFTFKALYLSDNTECTIIPASAFNGLYSADIKFIAQIYPFLLWPSHMLETQSSQTWLSCQKSVPQVQKGSSFLVQALIPSAPGYRGSQMQFAREFAASAEALCCVCRHSSGQDEPGILQERQQGTGVGSGSSKRWFTKRIPFISDPSSSETFDLTDTKYMGKSLVRLKKNRTQTNPISTNL